MIKLLTNAFGHEQSCKNRPQTLPTDRPDGLSGLLNSVHATENVVGGVGKNI